MLITKNGKITPSDEVKFKMCEIFNCSLDYLMGENNFRTQEEALNEYLKHQDRITIAKTIARYSEEFIHAGINDTNVNEILELLSFDRQNNTTDEQVDKIIKYLDTFDIARRKKLKELFVKILEELTVTEKNMNFFHYLMSSIENKRAIPHTHSNFSKFYMCPIYAKISVSILNWKEECIEGYLPLDPNIMNIHNPNECFFFKVLDDSMNKEISKGAYALIRKQDIVANGEIAYIIVNTNEATIKKFRTQGDLVILEPMSNNPNFHVQVYTKDTPIKILGKYIGRFEIKDSN